MSNEPDIDLALQVSEKTNILDKAEPAYQSAKALKRPVHDKLDNTKAPSGMVDPSHNSATSPLNTAKPMPPVVSKRYLGLTALHWLYLFALWTATILTLALSQNVKQFDEHGPIAFQNGFPGDLEQWARRGGWDNIFFEPDSIIVNRIVDSASYAYRTFSLHASDERELEKLRVTGVVKTLTKKADDDISDGGAVMVWLQDDSDKVSTYLNVGKLDGKEDAYEVSRVINLSENITRFSLVLTNKQSTAEFALQDASIELLTEQPLFSQIRIVVFLVWAILLTLALFYLFKRASLPLFVVMSTLMLLTVIGVLMPETLNSTTIKPLYEKLQNRTGLTGDAILEHAYKIGHFLFFFSLSLTLMMYRKALELPIWEIFLLMILFAFATEGMQLYLSDRTSRISDLIIDISAVFVAAMFALMIVSLKQDSTSPVQ